MHGISTIDTGFGRPQFDAAYLVIDDGRAAFIDTGNNAAVPRLLQALQAEGLGPQAVDWVIVTHVHLDHAGGAGLLMQQLPNARLAVHARGARHMVDPAQLLAGVRQVYGDEVTRRDYGDLVPVPAERVVATTDGMALPLGTRVLRVLDTPGHARHHHCIWDERSRGWFTGDTLGLAYGELRGPQGHYGMPTTTPVQFDPVALRGSIQRLLEADPQVAYLTHYGPLHDVRGQAEQVLRQMDAMVELATALRDAPERGPRLREGLMDLYVAEAQRRGVACGEAECRALLAVDAELNAQGLECWLG